MGITRSKKRFPRNGNRWETSAGGAPAINQSRQLVSRDVSVLCFRFERFVLKAILAGNRSLRSLQLTLINLSGIPSNTGPSPYAFCHRSLMDRPERRVPRLNVSAGWLGLPARSAERSRTHPQPLNVIVTGFVLNFATSAGTALIQPRREAEYMLFLMPLPRGEKESGGRSSRVLIASPKSRRSGNSPT
jgi:hypothetical protein